MYVYYICMVHGCYMDLTCVYLQIDPTRVRQFSHRPAINLPTEAIEIYRTRRGIQFDYLTWISLLDILVRGLKQWDFRWFWWCLALQNTKKLMIRNLLPNIKVMFQLDVWMKRTEEALVQPGLFESWHTLWWFSAGGWCRQDFNELWRFTVGRWTCYTSFFWWGFTSTILWCIA